MDSGTKFSWKFSGQCCMVSLTQSCSFWYGLKDLLTLHSCPMTSQAVEGTWIRMGAYKWLRCEWIKEGSVVED